MPNKNVIDIKAHEFEEKIKSHLYVVVDFWASWCGPCKSIGPILEKLAPELDVLVLKVNVDEEDNQALAASHGVKGIPNLFFYRAGEQVAQQVGALPEEELKEWIESNMKGSVTKSREEK